MLKCKVCNIRDTKCPSDNIMSTQSWCVYVYVLGGWGWGAGDVEGALHRKQHHLVGDYEAVMSSALQQMV